MKTITDVSLAFDEALKNVYQKQDVYSIKNLVINEITALSKAYIQAFPETELTTTQVEKIAEMLKQLQTGKPVQYILGHTEFYGLPFRVNPSVLIPRPETEELVEWIIETARQRQQTESTLDIGTGSGCIPITLKKHLPNAKIAAIDISREALKTATENAALNQVEVDFWEADILNIPLQHAISNTQYTIIVSNPPYVTDSEKALMHQNVLQHEPHTALFVPDADPLIFYKAIADFAWDNLQANGMLFFEINENLGPQTVNLLQQKGFKNVFLKQDMSGKDRMIRAERF